MQCLLLFLEKCLIHPKHLPAQYYQSSGLDLYPWRSSAITICTVLIPLMIPNNSISIVTIIKGVWPSCRHRSAYKTCHDVAFHDHYHPPSLPILIVIAMVLIAVHIKPTGFSCFVCLRIANPQTREAEPPSRVGVVWYQKFPDFWGTSATLDFEFFWGAGLMCWQTMLFYWYLLDLPPLPPGCNCWDSGF